MKHLFDIKPLVKESLREAFYTKKVALDEALFGHKLYVQVPTPQGIKKFKALISQNTIPDQHEYRLTIFNRKDIPMIHYSFRQNDLDYILQYKQLTPTLQRRVCDRFSCFPRDIKLIFVDKFDENKESLTEALEGVKFTMLASTFGSEKQTEEWPALLSKQIKPDRGGLPYRLTWFRKYKDFDEIEPKGHISLSEKQKDGLLLGDKEITDEISRKLQPITGHNIEFNISPQSKQSKSLSLTSSPAFKKWFGNSVVVDEKGEPMIVWHIAGKDFNEFYSLTHFGTIGQTKSLYFGRMGKKRPTLDRTYPVYLSIQNPIRIEDSWDNSVLSLAQRLAPEIATKYIKDLEDFHKQTGDKAKQSDELEYQKKVKAWKASNRSTKPQSRYNVMNIHTYNPHPKPERHHAERAMQDFIYHRDNIFPNKYKPLLIAALKNKGYDGIIYKNKHETADVNVDLMVDLPTEEHQKDSYIIFDPSQVKSAYGNIGTFDPNSPDMTKEHFLSGETLSIINEAVVGYLDNTIKEVDSWIKK